MTCEEAEALCLLGEEHLAEVAVAEADLAVFGDGAGDAERLETDADCGSGVGSLDSAALYSDSAADCVCPDSVFKADGWVPLTILSQSMPFARVISLHSSMEEMPY